MDERTLRRLLDPFEANVLILAARFNGDLERVRVVLAGRRARVDDGGHLDVAPGHVAQLSRVEDALDRARSKIERAAGVTMGIPDTAGSNGATRPDAPSLDDIPAQLLAAGDFKARARLRRVLAVEWLYQHGPATGLRVAYEMGIPNESAPVTLDLRRADEVEATGRNIHDWPGANRQARAAREYVHVDTPDSERAERSEEPAEEEAPSILSAEEAGALVREQDAPTGTLPPVRLDRLADFLYLLFRDELPVGAILKHVQTVERLRPPVDHTNDLLHSLAADTARRLLRQ